MRTIKAAVAVVVVTLVALLSLPSAASATGNCAPVYWTADSSGRLENSGSSWDDPLPTADVAASRTDGAVFYVRFWYESGNRQLDSIWVSRVAIGACARFGEQ